MKQNINIPDRHIPNRMAKYSRVIKCVVVDATGAPRPVHVANIIPADPKYGGDRLRLCTVQRACSWDYRVLYDHVGNAAPKVSVEQYMANDVGVKSWVPLTDAEIAWSEMVISQELQEFLNDTTVAALPVGCGWDGTNTTISIQNVQAVYKLFANMPEAWKRTIAAEAAISPPAGLLGGVSPLVHSQRTQLPMYMQGSTFRNDIRQAAEPTVEWVMWLDNGRCISQIVRANESLPWPDGVLRAAKVMRPAYQSKHQGEYGVGWNYYENMPVIDVWLDRVRACSGLSVKDMNLLKVEHV